MYSTINKERSRPGRVSASSHEPSLNSLSMNTTFNPRNPAIFEVPVPPEHFGQDGGKFYRYYDALAQEIDENMVTGLKEQLDALLIFTGLFAGINTAFLVLTLPLLRPDPADDTNALLKQNNEILLNLASGRNDSLPSSITLPSEEFAPAYYIVFVNGLFGFSLTTALLSSLLAVLGRHSLVYYRKRRGDGPDSQRWEQLKRFLGAERWNLESNLGGTPPALLQLGVVTFLIAFMAYLGNLNAAVAYYAGFVISGLLAAWTILSFSGLRDEFCPYHSPLAGYIEGVVYSIGPCVVISLVAVIVLPVSIALWAWQVLVRIPRTLHHCWVHGAHSLDPLWMGIEFQLYGYKRILRYYHDPVRSWFSNVNKAEDEGTLQIIAINRTICTSNDAQAQAYAVSNILAIQDGVLLGRLAAQPNFANRISSLSEASFDRTLQICGRDRSNLAAQTSWLYRAAITHIQLSTSNSGYSGWFSKGYADRVTPPLSPDMIKHAPQNLVSAWLGYMADSRSCYLSSARHLALGSIIVEVVNPSWRCISMLIAVIMVEWGVAEGSHKVLHAAYTGKPPIALQNLWSLLEKSNEADCQDPEQLKQYLVKIFKLIGKTPADTSHPPGSKPKWAASILHFSEVVIRAHESSSDLIDIGRTLREDLISALLLEYEEPPVKVEYPFKETLEELHLLFALLTASLKLPAATAAQWGITISNKDDVGLVSAFTPVLQKLNMLANTVYAWGGFRRDEDNMEFKRQVAKLNALFISFKIAVQVFSRQIKMLKRDPELGWCGYDEECEPPARLAPVDEADSQFT
ncbi:hypothetical protein FRC01_007852 [Tulasnella sp. 417]|nr:hypothetical protein FRC01_007852 [Tulasnella sp. 417]